METLRLMLVDDHRLLRAGLREILRNSTGMEIVGEAGSGNEALCLIETLGPDVLVTDIGMPGMTGIELAERACKISPALRVLMLTMHANEEYVYQSLRAGAGGYLLKDCAAAELEFAVRAVAAGDIYLTPRVAKPVVAFYLRHAEGRHGFLEELTPRQREILRLIADGHTTKEIARLLNVTVKTAEKHRTQLMQRLGIHEIAGLVRYAVRVGLVHPHA
jgi:DNA-binding NarL/FixJ family response regulator